MRASRELPENFLRTSTEATSLKRAKTPDFLDLEALPAYPSWVLSVGGL